MSETTGKCNVKHEYDDRRCILKAGHERENHESEDGFKWIHREEILNAGGDEGEIVETWDEPLPR